MCLIAKMQHNYNIHCRNDAGRKLELGANHGGSHIDENMQNHI